MVKKFEAGKKYIHSRLPEKQHNCVSAFVWNNQNYGNLLNTAETEVFCVKADEFWTEKREPRVLFINEFTDGCNVWGTPHTSIQSARNSGMKNAIARKFIEVIDEEPNEG